MRFSFRSILAIAILPLIAVDAGIAGCGTSSFTGESADASSDANAGDGQSSSDASTGDSSSDGGIPFCTALSPQPYFCADFDEETLQAAFQQGSPQNLFDEFIDGGDLSAASGGRSPPHELASSIPMTDASAGVIALVTTGNKIFDATGATTFHFDLDFKITSLGPATGSSTVTLFQLDLVDRGDIEPHHYPCQIVSGDLDVSVDGLESLSFGAVPASGVWVHARYDIDLRTPASFKATINGVSQSATGNPANSISTAPTVTVGVSSPGPTGSISVSFDNVTLTVETLDGG